MQTCPDCDSVMRSNACACGYTIPRAIKSKIPDWSSQPITPKDVALRRIAEIRQQFPKFKKYTGDEE